MIRSGSSTMRKTYSTWATLLSSAETSERRGGHARVQAPRRRMVTLSPDNMKWRMEEQYADANLGILLFDQRRFAEAAAQFSAALTTIRAISTADPANQEYRKSVAESLAWLADVEAALGRYDQAISARSQDIALLEGLLARTGDVEYRQRLVPAHRALGLLYTDTGQRPLAIAHYRRAIAYADALTAVEPSNTQWRSYGYQARINLANELLKARTSDESANPDSSGLRDRAQAPGADSAKPDFRKGLIGAGFCGRDCRCKAGQPRRRYNPLSGR